MTARENAVLNDVMMRLTPGESRDRLDAILKFAELQATYIGSPQRSGTTNQVGFGPTTPPMHNTLRSS